MHKDTYTKYIQVTNQVGSKKAASYIRAMDLLSSMLKVEPFSYQNCINIWSVNSAERIHELYEFVLLERRKGTASPWNVQSIPISYLRDGFCSAALRSYEEFLIEKNIEQKMFSVFDSYDGTESKLSNKLDMTPSYPKYLLEGLDDKQGKDVIRSVRVRTNQNVFRKMIMSIYNQSCCITGLNIPEINRASHIIPWAEDETKRLDPSNGLCLSATYDAAFDRNLISLDDDYRIILSKNIHDYSSSECVKKYFIKKEGTKISLPSRYKPNKAYLAEHRKKGDY